MGEGADFGVDGRDGDVADFDSAVSALYLPCYVDGAVFEEFFGVFVVVFLVVFDR